VLFELLSFWGPLHVLEPIQEARSEEPVSGLFDSYDGS
jgi:hypothetical protein